MKMPRVNANGPRTKLIATACDIFAEKGYRDTKIAEICEKAGTNIAAINYYFGNKEALYREVWHHVFAESVLAHPPGGGVPETASPEERLLGQVTALLLRMADSRNRFFNFLYWEFTNPTGLLEEVIKEHLQPLQKGTRRLVEELLGPCANKRAVQYCELTLIGQCMNPMVVRGELGKRGGGKEGLQDIDGIKAYAHHVVEFSLAGFTAVRKAAEVRRTQGTDKVSGKKTCRQLKTRKKTRSLSER